MLSPNNPFCDPGCGAPKASRWKVLLWGCILSGTVSFKVWSNLTGALVKSDRNLWSNLTGADLMDPWSEFNLWEKAYGTAQV
jgi:hypothetical protein